SGGVRLDPCRAWRSAAGFVTVVVERDVEPAVSHFIETLAATCVIEGVEELVTGELVDGSSEVGAELVTGLVSERGAGVVLDDIPALAARVGYDAFWHADLL